MEVSSRQRDFYEVLQLFDITQMPFSCRQSYDMHSPYYYMTEQLILFA